MRVEVFCEITFVMVCNGIFVIGELGWVEEMMGWVGLGYENWTHGHVCIHKFQTEICKHHNALENWPDYTYRQKLCYA